MNSHAKQRGVTLLELLIVFLIMTSVIIGASALVDNYTQSMRVSLTAQQMNQFGNAVQAYIKDNYQNVALNAKPTVPWVITAYDLMHEPITGALTPKYLPSTFDPINSYGQTLCALVLQPVIGGTPTLTPLVVTEGGDPLATEPQKINDLDLGQLAGLIGAAGGGIYWNSPGIVTGTMNKWHFNLTTSPVDLVARYFNNTTTKLCSPTGKVPLILKPGHPVMALWFNNDTSSAYLYRGQVPNHPELNSMQANLVFDYSKKNTDPKYATLGLNNISVYDQNSSNLKLIADTNLCGYSAAIVEYDPSNIYTVHGFSYPPKLFHDSVLGANILRPAIQVGTLGTDANGLVLSCQDVSSKSDGSSLQWKSQNSPPTYWGDPVDYFTGHFGDNLDALYPCNHLLNPKHKWETHIVKYPSVGSGPRAYTCAGPPWSWQPLAVDDNGVLQLGSDSKSKRAGDLCINYGLGFVAMNQSGQLLTCQPNPHGPFNIWVNSTIGNYRFQINGYSEYMIGVGVINLNVNPYTFSGTLHCDPQTYSQACGSGGTMRCPNIFSVHSAKAECAHFYAMGSRPGWAPVIGWQGLYQYTKNQLMVDVVDLPITAKTVWQFW